MNAMFAKDKFWALLQEGKDKLGQDVTAEAKWLTDSLIKRGQDDAIWFHIILESYLDIAVEHGIRDAASLMCHDLNYDKFLSFRCWLIAQGKEVYLAALKDPDSLADVEPYGDCRFECLAYVGDYAYERLTGRSAYDDIDHTAFDELKRELGKEITYKDGIQYPREPWDLPAFLPKLCVRYGGPDRFRMQESRWNHDLHEIRKLLDAGKLHDRNKAAKKEKQRGDTGQITGLQRLYE